MTSEVLVQIFIKLEITITASIFSSKLVLKSLILSAFAETWKTSFVFSSAVWIRVFVMPPIENNTVVKAEGKLGPTVDIVANETGMEPAAKKNPGYTLGYIPALDGLRGVSVMLILGYHDIGHFSSCFSHWLNAWFTVDMFFLISGYLITSILVKEQNKSGQVSLKNFYARRWLRIGPAYYLCLLAYLCWWVMSGDHHLKPFAYAALYLTNLDLAFAWNLIPLKCGISHFWTLGVEEQFYLVWPNLMKFARKHLLKIVALVIASVYIWRAYLIASGEQWMRIYHGFDTRVDTLMYGSLIAIALANGKARSVLQKLFANGWVQVLILALIFKVCTGLGHPGDGQKEQQFYLWQAKMPFVHLLFSALIVSLMLSPRAVASRFFSNPLPVYLGKMSYGIYLWHPLVHTVYCSFYWDYFNTHKLEAEVIQYALIIGVATLSYYLVEMPFLKLKSRFA